jgi:hypothetical protein
MFGNRSSSTAKEAHLDMDTSIESIGTSFGLEELRAEIDATTGQPPAHRSVPPPIFSARKPFLFSMDPAGAELMFKSPTGTESSVSAIQTLSTGATRKERGRSLFGTDPETPEHTKILEDLSMSADGSSSLHSSFDSSVESAPVVPTNVSSPPQRPSRPKSPMMTPITLRPMPDQVITNILSRCITRSSKNSIC